MNTIPQSLCLTFSLLVASSAPILQAMEKKNGPMRPSPTSAFAPYVKKAALNAAAFGKTPYNSLNNSPVLRKRNAARNSLPEQEKYHADNPSTCQQVGAVLTGSVLFFIILGASCYAYPH